MEVSSTLVLVRELVTVVKYDKKISLKIHTISIKGSYYGWKYKLLCIKEYDFSFQMVYLNIDDAICLEY